jgi:Gpi18-like mannosyltransferase
MLAWAGGRVRWVIAWFAAGAHAAPPLPWRALFKLALPLWLATRLLALLITYFSQTLLRASVIQSPRPGAITLDSLVNSWRLWDGGFYGHLVRVGYTRPIDADFWPLYPLLSKPFELLLGDDRWQISLLITSNVATLLAFVALGALAVQEDETIGAASRAMRLLAAAPLAFFLSAAYSDSLFLALATAMLLCARRGQWRAAALWAFLAALSRPVGIILIAPLLWEYARQAKLAMNWRRLNAWLPTFVLLAGAVPAAIVLFSLYCFRIYSDPVAWIHAEALFNHRAMPPWSAVGYAWQQFWHLQPASFQQARVLVDYAPLVFVAGFTVITIRRIPASFSLYLVVLLLVCIMSPVVGAQFPEAFVSAGRYLLAAVPVYLILARAIRRAPWLDALLVGGGFAMQALLMAFVLTGGWLV